MAEPDLDRRQRLTEVFLPAYNALHGSVYTNPPEPERPGLAFDLRWSSLTRGGPALEVQLTVGALDAIRDRVHPRFVAKVRAGAQAWCDQHVPAGFVVCLTFHGRRGLPHEANAVVAFVTGRLQAGMAAPPSGGRRAVLHRVASPQDLNPELELERLTSNTKTLVLAMPEGHGYIPRSLPRLREAIDRKQEEWLRGQTTPMLLLVDFDVDGYDGEDLPELRREAAAGPILFREVWGVSLWYPGERADRLWP